MGSENIRPSSTDQTDTHILIIGIGASAGGLETLNTFFLHMPQDSNMAFVVIQHLSPKDKSIMASLLGKQIKMGVAQIIDGQKIKPNHVYLNPPDKNVAIFNGCLHLMEPVETIGNMPIDFFFRSLSEDQGERAAGIILSGTASDGSLGVKAIKGENGVVMVQQPDTAQYDGMPRSAIGTGAADFILPVEKMPKALINYSQHPFLESQGKIRTADANNKNQLEKIFALIRSTTGHDFSYYKPNTIFRRIEHRMNIHQINKISDYVLYLQKNNAEIDALFKNLVIGVTRFFRDPEAYELLAQRFLLNLLKSKPPDSLVRVWVPGCSTGEEAYSLAMIISELMDKIKKYFTIQIFATDIDPVAIEFARRGTYPENIGADISQERLNHFFIKGLNGYQIKKKIRDMVVFSIQNLVKDPPFSRLDLVSCRNLMIYLDNVLQKKIIPLFHYTLHPGGILFLGTSESIGEYKDLFEPFNARWKIFKQVPSLVLKQNSYPNMFDHQAQLKTSVERKDDPPVANNLQALVERVVIDKYTPAGILINTQYEVLHFIGNTDKYLAPPTGTPSFNVIDMVREDLKNNLMVSIHKSVRENKPVFCKGVKTNYYHRSYRVDISVKPMTDHDGLAGFWLVMFEDTRINQGSGGKKSTPGKTPKKDTALQMLEQELQSTREYLQSTIEELEISNAELKSTNEERESVNEEMQSSNEELETSKEELQSTNEELSTVNAELQNKIDEYSKASNDLNNLLAATDIACIFLDIHLCIKNFTPAATNIVSLIETDIGRPLNDLKTNFIEIDLVNFAGKVLKDLNTIEMEILSKDDIWYSLKIMPYRTVANIIDGIVMTFVNVNKIKQADKYKRLATVLVDSNDAVSVLDIKGNILAWNKGAQKMYGWTESEALEMNIKHLLPKDASDELKIFLSALKKGDPIKSYQTRRQTKNEKIIDVWGAITALINDTDQAVEFALTERDLAWLRQE